MGLFDFLSERGRQRRFAERVMARMAELGWGHPTSFDTEGFIIDLGGSAGRTPMGALFHEWSRYPKREQDAALDQVCGHLFELGPLPDWDEARADLYPAVRPRTPAVALDRTPSDGTGPDQAPPWRPLGEHLAVHLAFERPHSTAIIDAETLAKWCQSWDQANAVALENLRARPTPQFQREEGGFWATDGSDFQILALLLAPEKLADIPLRGAPVAIAASRRQLLVAGAEEPEAVEAMAGAAADYLSSESRPVSFAAMIFEAGAWKSYTGDPGMSAVSTLIPLQLRMDYEFETPLLQGRLDRTGRPHEVAKVALLPFEGDVASLALWSEPASLLPRTDQIVIRTDDGAWARRWQDVEAAVGGFRLEPDTAMTYAVMDAFPDAETMAKIVAAPEPEWSKGRGIGIAAGRLTVMG